MFRVFVLSLFALSSAVEVLEVSGPKVVKSGLTHLPLRSVGGTFSTLPGLNHYSHGYNTLGYNTLGYNTLGLNSLGGVRSFSGLNSVNIAPSLYSYAPFQSGLIGSVGKLAVQQPFHHQTIVQQPAQIAISRPSTLSIAQPHVSVAQLAVRPQLLTTQAVHSQAIHPVNAAIQNIGRTVEYRAVPFNDQPIVPQDVIVEPSDQPINIHFKSRSSTVRLTQEHIAGEVQPVEQTQSEDEPSKVIHEVVKPVIQEVREVVQPYRQVTQEIQPVVERAHTVVSHGEGVRQQYVAEPIVKPMAVQQVVAQPLQTVVAQPIQQVVAQPVQHLAVERVQHVQPLTVQHVQHVQQVQPIQVEAAQPLNYQTIQVAQPIVRSLGFQHLTGPQVTRFAVQQQPAIAVQNVREHVFGREIVPEVRVQKTVGNDFIKYREFEDI